MGFFKPITARRLYELLDEVAKKHQGNPDAINLDAPISIYIPGDDEDDEGEYRKVISMGGGEFTDGLVLNLFDAYGD